MSLCSGVIPGEVDCLILGGGITGAGIARDAATRGLSVLLVDAHDFASGTSHLTSKLIHGGLRYLEHGRFKLVMESIVERDRLLNRLAPNLVRPLRFVIPFEKHQVPKWLVTVGGLQFYGLIDFIRGGRRSTYLTRRQLRRRYPALRDTPFAASFWDGQTNDARLVLATLRAARELGAVLRNYTQVTHAALDGATWRVALELPDGTCHTLRARSVVNATGPWAPITAERFGDPHSRLMWVKGSHIVVRKPDRFGRDAIVIRSMLNNRPLWVVPWYHRLLIGSTESIYTGDLRDVRPHAEEVDDLFESFRLYFPGARLTRSDIGCAFAGVRPIISQTGESENRLSREHRIDVNPTRRTITVSGGKLTSFRHVAEQTVDHLQRMLQRALSGTEIRIRLRRDPLWPGLAASEAQAIREEVRGAIGSHRDADDVVDHLTSVYGPNAVDIAREIRRDPSLGERMCEGLPYTVAEIIHVCRDEAVHHAIDALKRRTPLYFLMGRTDWDRLPSTMAHVAGALGWDGDRLMRELELVGDEWRADCAALSPRERAYPPKTASVRVIPSTPAGTPKNRVRQ